MNIGDMPSDERIRESVRELVYFTTCECAQAWTDRGLHERECREAYRDDVRVLARAAGLGFAEVADGVSTVAVFGPARGRWVGPVTGP